ncbi:MAG: TetR family transcriptional regulator [Nocardioides sp.]|nr:TetR family transcriptional regulator [Nocardioides sp.]
MTPPPAGDGEGSRPRVEGEREQEIFTATLDVLADVGYDRLTMDAVAKRASASKATLYRRWSSKPALVIEAVLSQKGPREVPDTGTLRGDLLAAYCGMGGVTDTRQMRVLGALMSAAARDEEFAVAFRRDFLRPKEAKSMLLYERAQQRGEIAEDVDLELVAPALAGMVLHRQFLLGENPSPELVTRIVDQIILPAVGVRHPVT